MTRKIAIAAAVALVLAGLGTISYTLAESGALEDMNRKYNIFDMVNESLRGMQEMGAIMGEVKNNVSVLNEKLDLVLRTNDLLEEQLAVVDEINAAMSNQKPILEETNQSLSDLEEKLRLTLKLAKSLRPTMSGLVVAMEGSLSLTESVVEGSGGMVNAASTISFLFDETLGYLARIQPQSAKAKAYMRGGILDRLSEFTPLRKNARSGNGISAGAGSGASSPLSMSDDSKLEAIRIIGDVFEDVVPTLLGGISKVFGNQ